MACGSNRQSALPNLSKINGWIIAGLVVEIRFILSVVYIPFLQPVFFTGPYPVAPCLRQQ